MVYQAWILSVCLLAATGCRRHAETPKEAAAVCSLTLPKHLAHTQPDALPADTWYSLLFKGYRDGLDPDPVDCSGEPIVWSSLPESCTEQEAVSAIKQRAQKLTAEQLVIRHAGGDYWFGWAPYTQFENGLSEGPIAIVRVHEGKLEARAIGNLRSYAGKSRLEVRALGAEHVLVAEGERCTAPGHCLRATRLMWLDRQRFRVRPLRSLTVRTCLGPAWFPHEEKLERKLNGHWTRVLQRTTALAYKEDAISLQEHIVVHDRDLDRPTLPPRLFRDAQAQLSLTIQAGEFLSEGQSLWKAIRLQDASTELLAQ